MLDAAPTRYGAVETPREGEVYANFLRENRGKFDGVILCLPNFGDETGAVAALQEAGVPILIQAYPDEYRPDGARARAATPSAARLSIMDVFRQYGVKFTALKPHTVAPGSDALQGQRRRVRPRLPGGERRARAWWSARSARAPRPSRPCASTRWPCSATASRSRPSTCPTSSGRMKAVKTADAGLPGQGRRAARAAPPGTACPRRPSTSSSAWAWCWTPLTQECRPGCDGDPLLDRDAAADGHLALRGDGRAERRRAWPRPARWTWATRWPCRRCSLASYQPVGAAGLEQQLRRRRRQVHPLPLRARCRQPDGRARDGSPIMPS